MSSLLGQIRSVARRLGILKMLSPIVKVWENARISGLGRYEINPLSVHQTEITCDDGRKFLFGPPDVFAEMAASEHERPMMTAMLKVFAPVAKDAVAWDIGANAGFYSLVLSLLVGERGHVYSFEPVPSTHAMLDANLKASGAANVTPCMLAMSNSNGTAPMAADRDSTTCSLEVGSAKKTVDVTVTTGDSLVREGKCAQPAIIKLDVEGHELKALEGMKAVLAHDGCKLVLCEVHFSVLSRIGESDASSKISTWLGEAGFNRLRWISRSHLLAEKLPA